MDHLLQDQNIKVAEDVSLNGVDVASGTKITVVSKRGEYEGVQMRVPPPEFEALLFFHAMESARTAENLKKQITITSSAFDGLTEIEINDSNRFNFFLMCQNAMASIAFSVSAIESWANNSMVTHGSKNGTPTELVLKRPNKEDKRILSNAVAADSNIPIRPKLFQLVPQVFSCPPLKDHSTLKEEVRNAIDDRNIVMHMQNTLNISDQEVERVNFAVKLFKVNSFNVPDAILKYINYVYEHSDIIEPDWVKVAKKDLKKYKKGR